MHIQGLLLGVIIVSMRPAFCAQPLTDTIYLAAGTSINITANPYGSNVLRTFCYQAKSRSLIRLFETVELSLSIANDDYSQYDGRTPEEVLQHYSEHRSLFSFTLFSQKRQRVQLSPFEQQCVGIASKQPYNVGLRHVQLDLVRLLQFGVGLVTIWSAGQLAKNSVFYYLAGIVVGICASFLVIIGITAKLFPRRPMMYGVMFGGWTIGLYIIKQLAHNIRLIMVTYRDYVLWYLAITGLVSFLICYRIGPPKNPRSQDIIKWVLQAVGAAIAFLSSWHTSASGVILAATFLAHYCPDSLKKYAHTVYKRQFTPKRRLLTQEEYFRVSVTATAQCLAELRDHVNSPHCRQWNMITILRDPMRFAGFANGAPHLYDEEIEDYSRAIEESMIGTDEDEIEEYLNCSMYYRPITARIGTQRPNAPLPPPQHLMRHNLLAAQQNNNANNNNVNNNQPIDESGSDDDDDEEVFVDQE